MVFNLIIMLENIDITAISITIISVIGIIFTSKVVLGHQGTTNKAVKQKLKDMEDYTEFLKKQVRVYKNKVSNSERGPQIDGSLDDLSELLPNLISQFGDYLPKWAQPLIKDKNTQEMLLKYVQENPEKAKMYLGKLIGKKNEANEQPTIDSMSV